MKRDFLLLGILFLIYFNINAQHENPFNMPVLISDSSRISSNSNLFSQEASYIGDIVNNLRGGNSTGSAYLGMANLKFSFDTKNLGLWNGGEIFINGAGTHGATPSQKLIGDFQVVSNIEAGDHIYLHELWYKQNFTNAEITIGLQDLNAQFVTSDYAGSFINSSFGIPSLIADNVPVPIFPLTALGITGKYQFSKSFAIQAAIFDGLPEGFEINQYNVNWNLNKNNGALILGELQLSTTINDLPGTYKTGGYYHSQLNETCEETGSLQTVFQNNYGLYFIADQQIWERNESGGIGMFIQLAASPGNINMHDYYIGGGLNYLGIFDKDGGDSFGIAAAHARFNCGEMKNETTIEMFYKSEITKNLFIQPDIQYIINPAGSEKQLSNALAFLIRFGINF